ncbi:MAG TPA: aminodeoxychorismate synthase component I [Steroidobacteraceae bacterium]|nr:aminodeoxychorismate synthase component I [Steroidobacteraceae bacterium]
MDAAAIPTGVDLLALHERFPGRYPVLLESVSGAEALGRTDLLFALPGARLVQQPDGTLGGDAPAEPGARFLAALDAWLSREFGKWGHSEFPQSRKFGVSPFSEKSPFSGGWFLYLGYELAQDIEPTLRLPRSRLPRAVAWRMQGAVLRDRASGAVTVQAETEALETALSAQVRADFDAIEHSAPRAAPGVLAVNVSEQAPAEFTRGVREVLEAIARGDVYQANLSRSWQAQLAPGATATDLYRALRRANPAPFAAIAALGDFTVLSSSPERLLQLRDGIASTRPIAGTRPRGRDAAADAELKRELRLNEKEQAEHVMLVDLERSDLGRICRGGTVQVDEYMTIETYATVHHIVSNVRGVLRDDVTPGQAIAAVFPGGTITGCPKVRCMQILADLERGPRDAYTGSLGYLDLDGTLDLNILIRTLTLQNGEIGFRTGAGIVADSVPEAELAETRAKANGILRALGERS